MCTAGLSLVHVGAEEVDLLHTLANSEDGIQEGFFLLMNLVMFCKGNSRMSLTLIHSAFGLIR